MTTGYIKLHRALQSHWINEPNRPRTHREAWEDILMNVNHSTQKVLLKGHLLTCERGQSLKSLGEWAKDFGWSISKVRHFFKMLQNDEMITVQNESVTTRLTVCEYEYYQGSTTDEKQADQTPGEKQKKSRPNTNKNDKNVNNTLLSQISLDDLESQNDKLYLSMANEFFKIVENNSRDLDIKFSHLEKAKFIEWTDPFRLLLNTDHFTIEQIRDVMRYLRDEPYDAKFMWKEQIRTPAKLRAKSKNNLKYFEEILIRIQKNNNNGTNQHQRQTRDQRHRKNLQDAAEITAKRYGSNQ